jgi:putative ABC transport system permease protein
MFKNYLVTAYRNLLRFKLDSLLNITGLVIGLTAALLIARISGSSTPPVR